jgi:hemoglobin/transferrin/lactoferrin receptor protein
MKKLKILFIFFALTSFAFSQEENKSDTNKLINLDEVIISANRTEEKKKESPFQTITIPTNTIELYNPQTSADMLMNTGGVFVQKSQAGGGSPVLRGFESSRVLLVIDGVRMNNAIYRAGHLQDVITIDPNMIERTEVVFGPSSTMYGSDALGGVMHFYTKKPMFGNEKMLVKGNTYARYSTANSEMTGHLDFNLGWKKFASLTSITYSDFGDVQAGNFRDYVYDQYWDRNNYVVTTNNVDSMMKNDNRNKQIGSAYSQYDILQKFAFKQNENILHKLNFQYSTSSNINRYDRLNEYTGNGNLRWAEWYYGPQTRTRTSLNTEIKSESKLFNKANFILAYQTQSQDRITRRFKNVNKIYQMDDVSVISFNADLLKMIGEKQQLNYGLELTMNNVQSSAKTVDILTSTESPAVTRYPDGGSKTSSYAAYITDKFKISDKLILSGGLRFAASMLKSNFNDTTFFPFPFKEVEQKSNVLTGNIGLVIMPTKTTKISLLGSTGFRTPNVDDLTKLFNSTAGFLIVANPDLKPENAYNFEIGFGQTWKEMVHFSVSGWHTILTNAMVLKDFKYNGQDSVLFDGQMSKVQAMQNVDEGFIQGLTSTLMIDFNSHFSFSTTATYTYGRYKDVENDTIIPLDHIPPAFGKTSLIFRSKCFDAEFYAIYNGWKELKNYSPSGEDNLQYATPYGMPSWITLNAKINWRITKVISMQTGLENIMDTHYRHFASGISAPGRNLLVTLRAKF